MKKILLLTAVVMLLSSNIVFADGFDSLEGITPAQKQKLSQIHFQYKQNYNSLEQRIMEYNSKLAKLNKEVDKTAAEIGMLSSAYQRNLDTLKSQKDKLELDTKELYKSVLTQEQYLQYEEQQKQVENAFSNFLQK